jgi:hypothetical protein
MLPPHRATRVLGSPDREVRQTLLKKLYPGTNPYTTPKSYNTRQKRRRVTRVLQGIKVAAQDGKIFHNDRRRILEAEGTLDREMGGGGT